MRVRKIAKQLKRFHASVTYDNEGLPVCGHKISRHGAKVSYIMRMTRKHYYGIAKRSTAMTAALCIHKACSPYLYDDILEFWRIEIH
jgi:hypothetical protein